MNCSQLGKVLLSLGIENTIELTRKCSTRSPPDSLLSHNPLAEADGKNSISGLWLSTVQSATTRAINADVAMASAVASDLQRNLTLQVLESLMLALSGSGEQCFQNMVRGLAKATKAKYVLAGKLKKNAPDTVRTLAVWAGNNFGENFEYSLKGTPCEDVMQQRVCYYPSGVQQTFPEDVLLAEMGVHTYLGVPLADREGQGIGLLVLLNDSPLPEPELARMFLEICAVKAAAEMQLSRRQRVISRDAPWARVEEEMVGHFRTVSEPIKDYGIFAMDERGNIAGWNPGAARVYGYIDQEVMGKPAAMLWRKPELLKDCFERARAGEKVEIQEQQLCKSGKTFVADIFIRHFLYRDGKPRGFVSIAKDLTPIRRMDTLIETGRKVVELLAFNEPLETVLEFLALRVERVFPNTHCAIMLLSENEQTLTCAAAPSAPAGFLRALEGPVQARAGAPAAAVLRRQPVTCSDVALDQLWHDLRETARAHDIRACYSHPLLSPQGRVLGTLDVYSTDVQFLREDEYGVIQRCVTVAGLAIERTYRLEAQSKAEHMRLKILEDLVSAEEDERRRISRELHDSTAQVLTSLLLRLRALQQDPLLESAREELHALRNATSEALGELRHILHGLHPSALDDFGLAVALRRYAFESGKIGNLKVNVFAEGFGDRRLPRTMEAAIYRVVQEALNNVVKHAKAANVQLFLKQDPDAVRVVITDDGTGFNVDEKTAAARSENRLGLAGMHHRIEMLGGSLNIESGQGKGTSIYLRIPNPQIS